MPNLNDLHDPISLMGPLPAMTAIPCVPPVVQPRAVVREVLGFDLDLDRIDRNTAMDVLNRVFRSEIDPATNKPVLTLAHPGEALTIQRGAMPLVGRMAVAAVALRTLAEHARNLDGIAALKTCDGDACGPEPLIAVIRHCILELVQHFDSGRPSPHAVEPVLRTLYGEEGFPADPAALGGALGDLRTRCRIDPSAACGLEDEKSVTNFNTLVALTAIFANAWIDARSESGPSEYFAVNVREVHHHLAAATCTLEGLRELVRATDWMTAEVPADPPISVSDAYELMHQYFRSGALEMLRHGRDGKRAVREKMATFEELVTAMSGGDADSSLRAFRCDGVQERLEDLLYHVQKVREVLA